MPLTVSSILSAQRAKDWAGSFRCYVTGSYRFRLKNNRWSPFLFGLLFAPSAILLHECGHYSVATALRLTALFHCAEVNLPPQPGLTEFAALLVVAGGPSVDALLALGVLDLPAGTASASAAFTITRPLDKWHMGVKTRESREPMSLSIPGTNGLVGSVSFTKIGPFALGRQIQPATYTVTLRQELTGKGAVAVIAGKAPGYVTGWQILSRTTGVSGW
ncbi:MAG TPA: hypothetical protein VNZ22_18680 [Bacillota bacterium]|nr:hypothetical protein [Bacillota bacterium]